jgi:sec-independent protein translocase protein TatA
MGIDNPLHIAFLLVVLLLVFGAKRLPEMGRSLGEGLRGFKSSINGEPTPPAGIAAPATVSSTAAQVPAARAVPVQPTDAPATTGTGRPPSPPTDA